MDHVKLQNNSEIDCVKRFLPTFNKINNSNYKNPIKNELQNEIDVFCSDGFNELKIQIKKAEPSVARHIGISPTLSFNDRFYSRDGDSVKTQILSNIKSVEQKYSIRQKNMSDILLLLDEDMNLPNFAISQIKKELFNSIFKEIWIVTRNCDTYKLY